MCASFELDPLALQERFSLVHVASAYPALKFQSEFDGDAFGTIGMFIYREGEQCVWDQFYPFGQTHEESFRSDLLGKGLGTLAHAQVLFHTAMITGKLRHATVRAFGAEPGLQKILDRAGNPEVSRRAVSLHQCLLGTLRSCDDIGFDSTSMRTQLEALLSLESRIDN